VSFTGGIICKMEESTIIAKLLPVKGEIKVGSKVIWTAHPFIQFMTVTSIEDGIAIVNTFEHLEMPVDELILVAMCAIETDFKAPCKVTALTNHAFAKFGKGYKLKKERERGKDNTVVIVKGFEKIGDFYEKAKADDLRKDLWMKKEVFGINLGEISDKAKWVTDGMSVTIKTKSSLLGLIEPKFNAQGKITVMCDTCTSYH